ncbi:hypothetical protein TMatcc_006076 [Talaromyces marneffei ATCC 18224]
MRESYSGDAFRDVFWTIGGTTSHSRASGAIACNKGHGKWASAMQSEAVPDEIEFESRLKDEVGGWRLRWYDVLNTCAKLHINLKFNIF